jgi:hypothetical protein
LLGCAPAGFENELVPDTAHGLEVNGTGGIRFEFFTQAPNVVIDCAGSEIVLESPDLVQQFIPRDHSSRPGYEEPKEFKFQRG